MLWEPNFCDPKKPCQIQLRNEDCAFVKVVHVCSLHQNQVVVGDDGALFTALRNESKTRQQARN